MGASIMDQSRFEPTVLGALRRFWPIVVVAALLSAAGAVVYTLVVPERYRAVATITVPATSATQGENSDQYLDSQVLLLKSEDVADRAVRIANAGLKADRLRPYDLSPDADNLKIIPPQGSTPGAYGSTIITVSFTWPDATVAREGANAVLQAFDDARAATITAEGQAAVAAIEKAMADARTRGQRSDLADKRTETLVNQQIDLARHPTLNEAAEPQEPLNGNSKRAAATGLLVGAVLGAGLAYAAAVRRRCLLDRLDPAAIYSAPLIAEISDRGRGSSLAAPEPLPMHRRPDSQSAEAYRLAAGFVERLRAARGIPLVVAVVSTGRGGACGAVANLALAVAESGTSVLAVDADATGGGGLTALLLPGGRSDPGFAQALGGQRSLSDCWQPSPLQPGVTVLGSGPQEPTRTTGAAYARAVEEIMGKAKASFDLVLVDGPALLEVADASLLLATADAAVVVAAPGEPVQDHLNLMDRLELVRSGVVGGLYGPEPSLPWLVGYLWSQRPGRLGRHADLPAVPSWDGISRVDDDLDGRADSSRR